jgi:DNA replication regulator DPB11
MSTWLQYASFPRHYTYTRLTSLQSVKTHRLPIFSGVTLCVSGIEDISLRTKINKLVTSQGGKYAKALERPIKVTHLLCSGDTQTDKMRYAQKFNQAGEANIYLVWEEWFWDCLEFGGRWYHISHNEMLISTLGRFDEEKYSVSQPRPQRKLGANAAPMMEMPQPSSAPMSSSIPPSTARSAHGRALDDPFVAAPTVDDDDELVSVRRVPAETLQVWASVLQPRGFVLSNGRLARSPSKSQANQSVASTSPCPPGPLPVRAQTLHDLPVQKMSSLANFSRVRSFAPVSKDISTPKNLFKRAGSKAGEDISSFLGGIRAREDAELADAANLGDDANADAPRALLAPTTAAQNAQAGPSRSRPFSGFKFVTHGETDCNSVHVAIEKCGGEVIKNKEATPDFILVRLARWPRSLFLLESRLSNTLYQRKYIISGRNRPREAIKVPYRVLAGAVCLRGAYMHSR